ncbi:hypothetical protein ACIQV3_27965 [Streptomyces sp. NPDC099050]|uniref:hypothetical protein n=1 Tax=Streptomyces sp. NPDC099050 TaxID=3366100 RepID=UPI0038168871
MSEAAGQSVTARLSTRDPHPDQGRLREDPADDRVPRQIHVRQSRSYGLVDGCVLRHADATERIAVYTWVRRGEPEPVTADLLELLAEVCPQEHA